MDANAAGQLYKGLEGLLKLGVQFAPVPGLVPAVDVLCALLIVCQNVQTNKEEAALLGQRCYQLAQALLQSSVAHDSQPLYVDRVAQQFIEALQVIMSRVSNWRDATFWDQFIKYTSWQKEIDRSNTEIDQLFQVFQASAAVTMLDLMRFFEQARQKDHDALVKLIDNIPGKLGSAKESLEDPAAVMGFIQEEVFKEKVKSDKRAGLVEVLNQVKEETGAKLPPMYIKNGVQITSASSLSTPEEGNNFLLWKGRFQGETVGIRVLQNLGGSEDDKLRRLTRELDMWKMLWECDRGKYISRIIGCTLADNAVIGRSETAIITPWNQNRNAVRYLAAHPDVDHTKMIMEIARGIRILHSIKPKPLIHGDIRGENVEISDDDGRALLTGFGLTKIGDELGRAWVTSKLSAHQQIRFHAPEHQSGLACQSFAGDIYSFGMTMLQLLTHDMPFAGDGDKPVTALGDLVIKGKRPQRPHDPAVIARGLNDSIWELMQRCWSADPKKRPDIHRVLKDLKRAWPHPCDETAQEP